MMNKHNDKNVKEDKSSKGKEHSAEGSDPVSQEEKLVTLTEKEYSELKNKEKEVQDKMLRLQADFDNAKKRLERDRLDFIKYANDQIIGELIPFVDDFQRAFAAADTTRDFNVLHKGVEMILNHLLDLLKKKGVSEIESLGKPFNPAFHEALLQVESDEYPENTVIEELQKGYMLNNRVLRTSKVKVAKAKEEASEGSGEIKDGTEGLEMEDSDLEDEE